MRTTFLTCNCIKTKGCLLTNILLKEVIKLNITAVYKISITNSHKQWYSKHSYPKYDYNICPQNLLM